MGAFFLQKVIKAKFDKIAKITVYYKYIMVGENFNSNCGKKIKIAKIIPV